MSEMPKEIWVCKNCDTVTAEMLWKPVNASLACCPERSPHKYVKADAVPDAEGVRQALVKAKAELSYAIHNYESGRTPCIWGDAIAALKLCEEALALLPKAGACHFKDGTDVSWPDGKQFSEPTTAGKGEKG